MGSNKSPHLFTKQVLVKKIRIKSKSLGVFCFFNNISAQIFKPVPIIKIRSNNRGNYKSELRVLYNAGELR
jgi:regulatory protein YycI of two-component signal transduction system YycFG